MSDERRDTPAIDVIVGHWREHSAELDNLYAHWIGWGEPFCFGCGWLPPVECGLPESWSRAGKWLDRAHLQDWCVARDDSPANVVMLCHICHDRMPEFDERADALAWVDSQPRRDGGWQMWTDVTLANRSNPTRSVTLTRARMKYLEVVVDLTSDRRAS